MKKTFKARLFTAHDQERFASLSGDFNPMHMDEAAARRTQAGTCAVHGVHAFLWALEQLAAAGYPLGRLTSARVDFTRFVRLAAPVTLDVCSHPAGQLRAELIQDERRVVGIDLAFANRRMPPREDPARRGHGTLPTAPAEPSLDDLRHARGSIEPPKGAETLAAELFPCTVAALGTGCTVSMGLLSSLVGMVAPGLHSIFSAIRIGFETGESPDWLRYEVASLDDRFRMVTIQVEGCGFAGSVGAFVRFPPVRPPALRDLEEKVGQGEFAARRTLVIGGSRGLGACTAKLIAAGGGSVVLTYLNGRSEAEAIRDEIAGRYGAERCAIARYDAAADPAAQLSAPPGRFSHAYYFATGRIADQADAVFDRRRLESFLAVYVDAFERLTQLLLANSSEARLHMFYPSSIFIEARPRGMTEYAMAKAAGEILCAELMRVHRNLTVSTPRLPRVLTDQTATVPPVPVVDPVAILLPLLRAEASELHR